MLWTKENKAHYLARKVEEAIRDEKSVETTLLEGLEFIEKSEKEEYKGEGAGGTP